MDYGETLTMADMRCLTVDIDFSLLPGANFVKGASTDTVMLNSIDGVASRPRNWQCSIYLYPICQAQDCGVLGLLLSHNCVHLLRLL